MTTEYADQVSTVKTKFEEVKTVNELKQVWKDNLNLGHRVMGQLLLGYDVDRIIARHE